MTIKYANDINEAFIGEKTIKSVRKSKRNIELAENTIDRQIT